LSVLPVTPGRILLARLVAGTLIILTLLGPLAVTGAVLWKFLGPPEWLFHNWLGDVFIGMGVSSLACYCLGLFAARRAGTFTSALRGLLLVPIIMLLIVIKGFDRPLLVVLLPFLAVSLFRCWKQDSNRFMTNIATGFTVLVLLAVPLYFGRNLCDGLLVTKMEASAKVSPSGLLPPEIENDPNVKNHSTASSRIDLGIHYLGIVHKILGWSRYHELTEHFEASPYILKNLGITEYFKAIQRGRRRSSSFGRPIHHVHLDEVRGQLIYRRMITDTWDDRFTWQWKEVIEIYAGPDGVSSNPDTLGRFSSPMIFFDPGSRLSRRTSLRPCIVYDRDSRRFYAIDFERQIIRKGPEVLDSSVQPVNAGLLPQTELFSPVKFYLPTMKTYKARLPIDMLKDSVYLTIFDVSGRIYLLDLRTLTLLGPAGHLPRPRTPFGWASSKPRKSPL